MLFYNSNKLKICFYRNKKMYSADVAQKKFLHIIDLVDEPLILEHLKLMKVYASAMTL